MEANQLLELSLSRIHLIVELLNDFLVILELNVVFLGVLLEFNVQVFQGNRAFIQLGLPSCALLQLIVLFVDFGLQLID